MLRKFRTDILSVVILVVLPGLLIWFRGDSWLGLHSAERRAGWIVALCTVFVVLFVWLSFDESSRPAIAARRIRYWVAKQFNPSSGQSGSVASAEGSHAADLRNSLRDRHGWRWRYHERWVLITGDEPLVKRLAPGLVATGYLITGGTVLLYAKQTTDKLDTDWLNQIRRLRSRRPIDAIVAVTRNRTSARSAFDADELAQRLARHARALRWAAPTYLVNVTDFGTVPTGPDEAIGFTWSNARVNADEVHTSLRSLIRNLADTGVERIAR
ncbi:type VI secretion protein VasK, partial [Paraburkholderia sp. BR14263]